jgi:DNA polymerase sigma
MLLEELTETIHHKYPQVAVNAFGSYSAGLSIFLSDIDISILFPPEEKNNEEHEKTTLLDGQEETIEIAPLNSLPPSTNRKIIIIDGNFLIVVRCVSFFSVTLPFPRRRFNGTPEPEPEPR